ncbi:MAG: LamG-like jellyroll fold domain-containing protein [Nitrososphaerales archaeon]
MSLYSNANTERLAVPDDALFTFNAATGTRSICFWYRPDALPGSGDFHRSLWAQAILGNDSFDSMYLLREAGTLGGNVSFAHYQGATPFWVGVNHTPSDDTWLFVGMIDDAGTFRLYVDDASIGTDTLDRNSSRNPDSIWILADAQNPDTADGRMAHVMYFDGKALSLAEFRSLRFNPKYCLRFPELVRWYPMFGTSGVDLSGNASNGTVTGATVAGGPPTAPPFGFDLASFVTVEAVGGRIMSSLVRSGGLAGPGGIAGPGGGLAA